MLVCGEGEGTKDKLYLACSTLVLFRVASRCVQILLKCLTKEVDLFQGTGFL